MALMLWCGSRMFPTGFYAWIVGSNSWGDCGVLGIWGLTDRHRSVGSVKAVAQSWIPSSIVRFLTVELAMSHARCNGQGLPSSFVCLDEPGKSTPICLCWVLCHSDKNNNSKQMKNCRLCTSSCPYVGIYSTDNVPEAPACLLLMK